jgi:hypothetical protein
LEYFRIGMALPLAATDGVPIPSGTIKNSGILQYMAVNSAAMRMRNEN